MFIRKVSPEFPDEILKQYIFKKQDELLTNDIYSNFIKCVFYFLGCVIWFYIFRIMFKN